MSQVSGTITVNGKRVIFTPDESLPQNAKIKVKVYPFIQSTSGLEMVELYESHFTTSLSPFYATVGKIRSDVGKFLGEMQDDEIAWTIHEVSKWADQISARDYGTTNEEFPGERQQVTDNKIFFHEYTRYETDIRLLMRRTAEHAPSRGETSQFGDVSFRAPGSLSPEISVVLSRIEARRDEALRYLKLGVGSYPLPMGTTLGRVSRPRPSNLTRRTF